MTLISFVNFGIVAMTGLLLNMGSVGNSTMNPTVASDEAVESKGCAASFGNQTLIPFYFDPQNGESKADVENLDNWKPDGSEPECGGTEYACMILVDPSHVDFGTTPISLLPTIDLVVGNNNGRGQVLEINDDSSFENRNF